MVRLIVQNYSCNYRFNRGTRKACATYSRYGDSGKQVLIDALNDSQ